MCMLCGDPVGIRTLDLLIRSQSLYPAELPSHMSHITCDSYILLKDTLFVKKNLQDTSIFHHVFEELLLFRCSVDHRQAERASWEA